MERYNLLLLNVKAGLTYDYMISRIPFKIEPNGNGIG